MPHHLKKEFTVFQSNFISCFMDKKSKCWIAKMIGVDVYRVQRLIEVINFRNSNNYKNGQPINSKWRNDRAT